MEHRVLEVCYDLDAIPGPGAAAADRRAARFRDGALAKIDEILFEDGLGHSIGTSLEDGKLVMRFVVMDFDAAEARVTWALDAAAWGPPAELLRYWDAQAVA